MEMSGMSKMWMTNQHSTTHRLERKIDNPSGGISLECSSSSKSSGMQFIAYYESYHAGRSSNSIGTLSHTLVAAFHGQFQGVLSIDKLIGIVKTCFNGANITRSLQLSHTNKINSGKRMKWTVSVRSGCWVEKVLWRVVLGCVEVLGCQIVHRDSFQW